MHVKFFATYREIAGCRTFETPAPDDVHSLMIALSEKWPKFRPLLLNADATDLGEDAIVLVNGRHIEHLDGIRTKLKDDDSVAVTPLVAGG